MSKTLISLSCEFHVIKCDMCFVSFVVFDVDPDALDYPIEPKTTTEYCPYCGSKYREIEGEYE